jgi:hypothetical protein
MLFLEREIDRVYVPLAQQNIFDLLAEYKFPRSVLHKLYGQYKTYLNIVAVRNPAFKIETGIDKETFQDCLSQLS